MKNKDIMKIIIALTVFFLGIGSVFACSCIYLPDAEAKMNQADVVFTGKVVNVDTTGDSQKATFQVYESWKMEDILSDGKLVLTASEDTGANCGFNFREGEEYLIYGYINDETGEVGTSSCAGNLVLSDADGEIVELNNLIQPFDSNPPPNIFQKFVSWLKNLFG